MLAFDEKTLLNNLSSKGSNKWANLAERIPKPAPAITSLNQCLSLYKRIKATPVAIV